MANFFLDRTNNISDLAGTWTFTNASTAVTGSGGNAQTLGLGAGDYVKAGATQEWYKIASVGGENSITLSYAFVQATQTSVVASYTDVSVNDGTTTGKAFVHHNQFCTDLVRSAGDILYVRRNQTFLYEGVNITFDENGTLASPIEIIGDDGTYWTDTDIRPIINFTTTTKQMNSLKNYWNFRKTIWNGSSNSQGIISTGATTTWFYNCLFRNCTGGAYACVFLFGGADYYFENCDWTGNSNKAVNQYQGSYAKFVNCTWDNNSICVVSGNLGSLIDLVNCSFGQTTVNASYNISVEAQNGLVTAKNCMFETGSTKITCSTYRSEIRVEDYNRTKGDHRLWTYQGTVVKDTATVRSGGATSSAKVTPNSNVSGVVKSYFQIFEACLYAPASQKTYSLYMLGNGWSTLPTNAELYVEVEYFDEAGTAHKATAKSTQVLSTNDVWTQLSVTVTPTEEGLLRIKAYLTKYQAGAYVYVDIKPTVT